MDGGGACGAIFRAAGQGLAEECQAIMERRNKQLLLLGEVEITESYNLKPI